MTDEVLLSRVAALESWKTTVEVSLGKSELTQGYINERFNRVEEELKGIKNTSTWLNRTVWAAIIVYVAKFLVSGGLAGVA